MNNGLHQANAAYESHREQKDTYTIAGGRRPATKTIFTD